MVRCRWRLSAIIRAALRRRSKCRPLWKFDTDDLFYYYNVVHGYFNTSWMFFEMFNCFNEINFGFTCPDQSKILWITHTFVIHMYMTCSKSQIGMRSDFCSVTSESINCVANVILFIFNLCLRIFYYLCLRICITWNFFLVIYNIFHLALIKWVFNRKRLEKLCSISKMHFVCHIILSGFDTGCSKLKSLNIFKFTIIYFFNSFY